MNSLIEITTDGSQTANGNAGVAAIIRIQNQIIPIKILGFLGKVESSRAELWAAILAFAMLKTLKKNFITISNCSWISDSKTSLDSFCRWETQHWKKKSGEKISHLAEWKIIEIYTRDINVCCVHKQRNTKHRSLSACDKASRWAASIAEALEHQNTLEGKNTAVDPRYAWQIANLRQILDLDPQHMVDRLDENLAKITVYENYGTLKLKAT